jgi:hypothetical protein
MSNKMYDILKNIALIILPALATLYLTVAQIWGLPYGEQVAATITALDVFLGAILKVSSINYAKKQEAEEKITEAVKIKDSIN